MKLIHLIAMVLTTSFFTYAGDSAEEQKHQPNGQASIEIKHSEKGPLSDWSLNQRAFDRKNRKTKQKLVWLPNDPSYLSGYEALGIELEQKYKNDHQWVRGKLPLSWKVKTRKASEGGTARVFCNEGSTKVMRVFHYYRKDDKHQRTEQDECATTFIGKEKKVEKFSMQQQS